jgi:hypothetical protein
VFLNHIHCLMMKFWFWIQMYVQLKTLFFLCQWAMANIRSLKHCDWLLERCCHYPYITIEKNCVLVDYFSIDVVSHFAFDVAICFTLLLIMDLLWRPSHLIKQLLYQGCYFVIVWMSMNKWTQENLFRNILLTSVEYYLTHKTKYLVTWKNILPCVMDELFSWMKNGWKIKWMNFQMNVGNKSNYIFPPLLLVFLTSIILLLVMMIHHLSKIVLSFISHCLDNFQIKICLNPFSSKEAWKGVFSNLCCF